jgi:hypothetical protein
MVINDRGSQFVALFWEQLHASLKTHLIHSSAYHPVDGWPNRVSEPNLAEYAKGMCDGTSG